MFALFTLKIVISVYVVYQLITLCVPTHALKKKEISRGRNLEQGLKLLPLQASSLYIFI